MKSSFLPKVKTLFAAGTLLILCACLSPDEADLVASTMEPFDDLSSVPNTPVPNTPTVEPLVNSTGTVEAKPTFDSGSIIHRWSRKASATMPAERWQQYEMAILVACHSLVYFPAEKLCEWDVITTRDNVVYVWAFCVDNQGRGRSGPVAIYLNPDGMMEKALCPRISDEAKALFPADLFKQIRGYREFFDLDKAWAHLERRFEDRSIPPLIVLEGRPLP